MNCSLPLGNFNLKFLRDTFLSMAFDNLGINTSAISTLWYTVKTRKDNI